MCEYFVYIDLFVWLDEVYNVNINLVKLIEINIGSKFWDFG